MNNCYTFRVLHLKTEQTRGLAPVVIKANPARIAVVEAKYRVSHLLLERIWQTLLQQLSIAEEDALELSTIILNDYKWQCQRTENEMILSVQKLDGGRFQNPVVEFCHLIDSITIDPTAFLRLSTEEQFAAVEQACACHLGHKIIKVFDLAINNHKILLHNKSVSLTKASQLELIELAIAVTSLNNPNLRIIKINNWLLLNPAHIKPLEKIATKLDCLLWFTMGVCSRI